MSASPAPCIDWSSIGSAAAESAFAGILAGFVFLGMIAIWTVEHPASRKAGEWPKRRSYALQFFSVAFIVLALDSYTTAITSGEVDCNRASVEEAFSGGALGIGAAIMLAGLAWQLVTLSERVRELKQILRWMLSGLGFLILFMLSLSAMGIGDQLLGSRSHQFVDRAPWILGGTLLVATVAAARFGPKADSKHIDLAVLVASLAALADGIFSALLSGFGGTLSIKYLATASTTLIDGIVVLAVLMPGIALIATAAPAVAAVTRDRSDPSSSPNTNEISPESASSASLGRALEAAERQSQTMGEPIPAAVRRSEGTSASVQSAAPGTNSENPRPRAMARGLSRETLSQRYDTYLADHYLSVHMTVVSLALGVAGLAAASLIAPSPRFGGDQIALWALWLVSLLATATAYAGTMNGAIILPSRIPAVIDLLLPLMLGITELVLFAILAYQATGLSSVRSVLTAWWFAFGVFGIVAATAVSRAIHVIDRAPYDGALQPAVENYLAGIRRDRMAAGATGALGAAAGTLHAVYGQLDIAVNCGAALLVALALCVGLNSHRLAARRLQEEFTITLNHPHAPSSRAGEKAVPTQQRTATAARTVSPPDTGTRSSDSVNVSTRGEV